LVAYTHVDNYIIFLVMSDFPLIEVKIPIVLQERNPQEMPDGGLMDVDGMN